LTENADINETKSKNTLSPKRGFAQYNLPHISW